MKCRPRKMDRRKPDGVGRRNRFEEMDSKTSAVTFVRGRFFVWNSLLFVYGTGRWRPCAGEASIDKREDARAQSAVALRLLESREMDRGPGNPCDNVSCTGCMLRCGNMDGVEFWCIFTYGFFELRNQRAPADFCQYLSAMAFLCPGILFLDGVVYGIVSRDQPPVRIAQKKLPDQDASLFALSGNWHFHGMLLESRRTSWDSFQVLKKEACLQATLGNKVFIQIQRFHGSDVPCQPSRGRDQ